MNDLRQRQAELSRLTEDWDTLADSVQREAAGLRYGVARKLAENGTIVDLACGTGFGLDHAARSASRAVGGDLSFENLIRARARSSFGNWVQFDAQALPLRRTTADVATCFEAIYYLPSIPRFLAEARRVLRPGGRLVITLPNRDRPGFSPSPQSHTYPTLLELRAMCVDAGFSSMEGFGAFTWRGQTFSRRVLDVFRRAVGRLGLMPRSMAMRGLLKRFAYRDVARLTPLEDFSDVMDRLVPIEDGAGPERAREFLVFYAIATK